MNVISVFLPHQLTRRAWRWQHKKVTQLAVNKTTLRDAARRRAQLDLSPSDQQQPMTLQDVHCAAAWWLALFAEDIVCSSFRSLLWEGFQRLQTFIQWKTKPDVCQLEKARLHENEFQLSVEVWQIIILEITGSAKWLTCNNTHKQCIVEYFRYDSTLFFSEHAALLLTHYCKVNGKKSKYVCL